MLVEHFIEPEFLIEAASKTRNYKDFKREFDRQSPRVVGEIQKFRKFHANVLKTQGENVNELAKGRLVEILNIIKEKCLVSRDAQYDGAKPYLDNFIAAHQKAPTHVFCMGKEYAPLFDGIRHVFASHFDEGIDSMRNQIAVRKSIDEMLASVKDFLRLSTTITFVDPYFSERAKMLNPMLKFIEAACTESPTKEKHIRILYKSRDEAPNARYIVDKLTEKIDFQKLGLSSLKVIALAERDSGTREKLHNRYIISNLGALIWGIGLDEDTSEVSDDVVLMDDQLYDKRHAQYCDLIAFDIADQYPKEK